MLCINKYFEYNSKMVTTDNLIASFIHSIVYIYHAGMCCMWPFVYNYWKTTCPHVPPSKTYYVHLCCHKMFTVNIINNVWSSNLLPIIKCATHYFVYQSIIHPSTCTCQFTYYLLSIYSTYIITIYQLYYNINTVLILYYTWYVVML